MSKDPAESEADVRDETSGAWPERKSLIKVFLYPGLIMIGVVLAALVATHGMKVFPFLYSSF